MAILPAGNQPWNRHVLAASLDRFAYCSSIAVYIYKVDSWNRFVLDKLIAGHKNTITGLTWNPSCARLIATSSVGKRLCVWDVQTEKETVVCATSDAPLCLDWNPFDPSVIVFATDKGGVYYWDTQTNAIKQIRDNCGVAATVIRWNPKTMWRIACGFADGTSVACDADGDGTVAGWRKFKCPEAASKHPEVADVIWDPLSTGYLLVAHKAGNIVLYDVESETTLSAFDVQTGGACSLQPSIPRPEAGVEGTAGR
eukprot:m51a1_g685 hypothetical protein (255) ;mRNA; f:320387-321525